MKKITSILNFFNKKVLRIEKRIRFVISTLALTFLMLLSTFFFFDKMIVFSLLLILFGYFFTYFAIIEGIEGIEWLTLFLMPIILGLAFYFFYFLFPVRWLTRLPFIIIYAISVYANLLASNIFNVRVERSLQLYRAAFSVNFFYHTLIVFLIFNSLFSFHFGFIINMIFAGLIIFVLSLQLYWTVKTPLVFDREIILYAFLASLVIGQAVAILSFIPVSGIILALFVTSAYYSLSGIIYSYMDERLFKETIREYLFVLGFVFVIMLLSIR